MPIKKTIQIGHPALKANNKKIVDFNDPKLKELVQNLKDSMHHANLIGMAAPQIAENFQVFITEPRETAARPKDQADELRVFINPKIIKQSKKQNIIYEGCGSVLNGQLFGPVKRPQTITIQASDEKGKLFKFTADGILGRVIQHEHDHMNGIEFLEKISDYKKMMTLEHYLEQIKNDPTNMAASKITIKEFKYI